MASTKYISEALIAARPSRQVENELSVYICNMAIEKLWNMYDWRETLATLPPFFLIPAEQDYGLPFYAVPNDFRGLRSAYLVQTTSVPPNRAPLRVIRDVQLTPAMAFPNDIGYEADLACFRVFPRAPNNIGATDFLVEGTYKKRAPQVTMASLQSTLIPWDDEYFATFVQALKWAAAEADDNEAKADKALAKLQALGADMAEKEGLDLGDPTLSPAEPLANPTHWWVPFQIFP